MARRRSRGKIIAILVAIPAVVIPLVLIFAFVAPTNDPPGAMPGMPDMGSATATSRPGNSSPVSAGDAPIRRVAVPGGSYGEIDPETLADRLSRKDFALINVHIPYEGEIAPTDRFIPYDRIGDETAQLPADRAATLILYCETGRMSADAAATLVRLGYRDVSHLAGGMEAWRARGYPLITRP